MCGDVCVMAIVEWQINLLLLLLLLLYNNSTCVIRRHSSPADQEVWGAYRIKYYTSYTENCAAGTATGPLCVTTDDVL